MAFREAVSTLPQGRAAGLYLRRQGLLTLEAQRGECPPHIRGGQLVTDEQLAEGLGEALQGAVRGVLPRGAREEEIFQPPLREL